MRTHKIDLSNQKSPLKRVKFLFWGCFILVAFTTSGCSILSFTESEEDAVESSSTPESAMSSHPANQQTSDARDKQNTQSASLADGASQMKTGESSEHVKSSDRELTPGSSSNPSEEPAAAGFISKITKTLTFQDKNLADQENLQKARMMARLNDLETKVNEQSQKIRVLEKAVKLGIIPEELKLNQTNSAQLLSDYAGEDEGSGSTIKKEVQTHESRKSEYKKDMAEANSLYTKGEYGKAFVAFQKIDQKYSESDKQGESLYWMGRCWFALKEYQTAKQYFKDMIRSNPASTRVGQAKVLIAQSELKLGLNEDALATLRDIIRDHPEGHASDEARKLLSQLKDSL